MVTVSMISLPVTHLTPLFGGKNIDYTQCIDFYGALLINEALRTSYNIIT